MPDSSLRLCTARLYYFYYDVIKPLLQNLRDETEMVRMFIRYCLFNMVMPQKIRKNKRRKSQIRTVIFSKT